MGNLNAGWGWPINFNKAHYFKEGEAVSLCGVMYSGSREQGNDASPDNCAGCKRKLKKLINREEVTG